LKLEKLIEKTAGRFKAAKLHFGHGTDNAHDEAAFLVLRGLGLPFDTDLSGPADPSRIEKLVQRRIEERIPAAYLLKEAWLDGERFYIDQRVIVPRSHIAFLLKDLPTPKTVLDLCTGSACLAVLAARSFPRARVSAADISRDALAVARRNVGRRIRLIQSDLFDRVRGTFDLILANPPYVTSRALRALPPEYRYEPGLALAAGNDGLDVIHRIIGEAQARLNAGGMLVCEVGDRRAALERAYPRLRLRWPRPEVFILAVSRTAGASRTPPTRTRAR
jgi:ribosomal protein L3 glutamine methyltransferase